MTAPAYRVVTTLASGRSRSTTATSLAAAQAAAAAAARRMADDFRALPADDPSRIVSITIEPLPGDQ